MDPSTQLSLFGAWRHPAMGMGSMAGMGMAGMDITHAAYRYNQNMMEYYTCKAVIGAQSGHQGAFYADGDNNILLRFSNFCYIVQIKNRNS